MKFTNLSSVLLGNLEFAMKQHVFVIALESCSICLYPEIMELHGKQILVDSFRSDCDHPVVVVAVGVPGDYREIAHWIGNKNFSPVERSILDRA